MLQCTNLEINRKYKYNCKLKTSFEWFIEALMFLLPIVYHEIWGQVTEFALSNTPECVWHLDQSVYFFTSIWAPLPAACSTNDPGPPYKDKPKVSLTSWTKPHHPHSIRWTAIAHKWESKRREIIVWLVHGLNFSSIFSARHLWSHERSLGNQRAVLDSSSHWEEIF